MADGVNFHGAVRSSVVEYSWLRNTGDDGLASWSDAHVAPGTPNSAEVRVTDIEFLGSFCRVGLAPAGNAPPLLADFSINVVRDLGISPGQSLLISLPPDRIRVFPGAPQLP